MSAKHPLHARIYWKIPLAVRASILKIGHIRVFCTRQYYIFLKQSFLIVLAFLEKWGISPQFLKLYQ